MIDRGKVIRGLECCRINMDEEEPFALCLSECPYNGESVCVQDCRSVLCADALELLKEQEAVEPILYHRSDGTIFKYECRQCRTKIFKMDLFCRHCGQAVKWE